VNLCNIRVEGEDGEEDMLFEDELVDFERIKVGLGELESAAGGRRLVLH
jgi:hypothetical protein